MTLHFQNNTIEIFRKRRIGATHRWSMSATLTAYAADIQPETRPERVEMDGSRYGTMWVAFVDVSVDIKEGDELHIVDTGKVYSVKGVQIWDGGLQSHKELTLISQDGNAS